MLATYLTGAAVMAVLMLVVCWGSRYGIRENLRMINWLPFTKATLAWPFTIVNFSAHYGQRLLGTVERLTDPIMHFILR
jgi:hypothetical protein